MFSPTIEKLIKLFSKFPTVGPRTASRFVFYLIKKSPAEVEELLESVKELKQKINICQLCFKSFEANGEKETCAICSDTLRDKSVVCIVEKEVDLETIEKTKQFKGLYFILDGLYSGMKKDEEKTEIEQKIERLLKRLKDNGVVEIILALNPTTEGRNTILWLKRKLEPLNVKVSELGRGLPIGGELEYADEETITSALEGRR